VLAGTLNKSRYYEQEVGANLEVADQVNRTRVPRRIIGGDENISRDRDYPFCCSGCRTAGCAAFCHAQNIISRPNQGSAPGTQQRKKRLNLAGMGPGRQWKAPVGHSSETTEQQFEALKEVEAPVVRCNEDAERKNASLALCCAAFHSGVFEIGLAAGC